jgi:hypothetical protein
LEDELENFGKLANGIYLQMCAKAKEMYKDKTDEELLTIYFTLKKIVETQTALFKEQLQTLPNAVKEMLKERGIVPPD